MQMSISIFKSVFLIKHMNDVLINVTLICFYFPLQTKMAPDSAAKTLPRQGGQRTIRRTAPGQEILRQNVQAPYRETDERRSQSAAQFTVGSTRTGTRRGEHIRTTPTDETHSGFRRPNGCHNDRKRSKRHRRTTIGNCLFIGRYRAGSVQTGKIRQSITNYFSISFTVIREQSTTSDHKFLFVKFYIVILYHRALCFIRFG